MFKLVAEYWQYGRKVKRTIAIYPTREQAEANRDSAWVQFYRDWQIDALIVVRELKPEAGNILVVIAVLFAIPACLFLLAAIRIHSIGY